MKIWGFKKEQHQGSDCAFKKPRITKGGVKGLKRTSKAPKTEREKPRQGGIEGYFVQGSNNSNSYHLLKAY